MNLVQLLFKNTLALAVSAVAYRIGLAAVEIVIARNVAPADYGEFATALGFAALFLVVIDLGVNLGLVRVISRGEAVAPTYFGNSLVIRLGLAIVVYLLMLVVAGAIYPSSTVTLIALLGAFVVLLSFQDLLAAVFQGRGEMEWIALFRITQIAAVCIAVFATLNAGGSIRDVALAHVAAGVVTALFALAVTLRRFRPRIEWRSLFRVVADSYLYGLVAIFSILAFRLGVVILSLVAPEDQVGFFAAGQRIVEVLSKAPVLISMVLIPLMFRAHQDDPDRLERLYRLNIRVTGLGALPLAALILLFAPDLIGLLYRESYAPAERLLRILAIGLPFSFLSVALGDQLTTRDCQVRRTWIHGSVVAVGLAAHALLASRFGATGSASAAVITEVALFVLLVVGVGAGIASLRPLRGLVRPIVSVVIASASTILLADRLPPAGAIAAFCAIYLVAVFLTRAIEPEEVIRTWNRLLTREKSATEPESNRTPRT